MTVSNPSGTAGTLRNGWIADFGDVPGSQQFYTYITKLVSNQITVGCGAGNYCPDANVTRQQMAVFLLKGKHGLCYVPPTCTPGFFGDVPCPSTYANWIEALANEGITGGCGDGNYCPTNPVRRDQMAVFLLKSRARLELRAAGLHAARRLPRRPLPGNLHQLDRGALHREHRRRLRQRQLLPDEPQQPRPDGRLHHEDLQPAVTRFGKEANGSPHSSQLEPFRELVAGNGARFAPLRKDYYPPATSFGTADSCAAGRSWGRS